MHKKTRFRIVIDSIGRENAIVDPAGPLSTEDALAWARDKGDIYVYKRISDIKKKDERIEHEQRIEDYKAENRFTPYSAPTPVDTDSTPGFFNSLLTTILLLF